MINRARNKKNAPHLNEHGVLDCILMHAESDNKKQTEKQDRYREQIGGCQWQVVERISEMCEGSQK